MFFSTSLISILLVSVFYVQSDSRISFCLCTIKDLLEEYALYTIDQDPPRYNSIFPDDLGFFIRSGSTWKPVNNATWLELFYMIKSPTGIYTEISLDGKQPVLNGLLVNGVRSAHLAAILADYRRIISNVNKFHERFMHSQLNRCSSHLLSKTEEDRSPKDYWKSYFWTDSWSQLNFRFVEINSLWFSRLLSLSVDEWNQRCSISPSDKPTTSRTENYVDLMKLVISAFRTSFGLFSLVEFGVRMCVRHISFSSLESSSLTSKKYSKRENDQFFPRRWFQVRRDNWRERSFHQSSNPFPFHVKTLNCHSQTERLWSSRALIFVWEETIRMNISLWSLDDWRVFARNEFSSLTSEKGETLLLLSEIFGEYSTIVSSKKKTSPLHNPT